MKPRFDSPRSVDLHVPPHPTRGGRPGLVARPRKKKRIYPPIRTLTRTQAQACDVQTALYARKESRRAPRPQPVLVGVARGGGGGALAEKQTAPLPPHARPPEALVDLVKMRGKQTRNAPWRGDSNKKEERGAGPFEGKVARPATAARPPAPPPRRRRKILLLLFFSTSARACPWSS